MAQFAKYFAFFVAGVSFTITAIYFIESRIDRALQIDERVDSVEQRVTTLEQKQ